MPKHNPEKPNNEPNPETNKKRGRTENRETTDSAAADKARAEEETNPEKISALKNELDEKGYFKEVKERLKKTLKLDDEVFGDVKTVGAVGTFIAGSGIANLWKAGKGLAKATFEPLWDGGGELIEFLGLKPLVDGAKRGYKTMRKAFGSEDKKEKNQ